MDLALLQAHRRLRDRRRPGGARASRCSSFPGPGLLVIVAGLAVLATEFAWAKVALDKTKEKASQAGSVAKKGLGRLRGRKPSRTRPDQPPPST